MWVPFTLQNHNTLSSYWIPVLETCCKQRHYLLSIVLCAGTVTIVVTLHSKLPTQTVECTSHRYQYMNLLATYSDVCQHIMWLESVIRWYWLCRCTMYPCIMLGVCIFTLLAQIHTRTKHYLFVTVLWLSVSGVVTYLEGAKETFLWYVCHM
jgi:hypothetical protein